MRESDREGVTEPILGSQERLPGEMIVEPAGRESRRWPGWAGRRRDGWRLPGTDQIVCPEVTVSVETEKEFSPAWPPFRLAVSPLL